MKAYGDHKPSPGCCPGCGSRSAHCVVGNYWSCPNANCKNYSGGKKKADPEKEPALSTYGSYTCDSCGVNRTYAVAQVAAGQRCITTRVVGSLFRACGGTLRIIPGSVTP